MFRGRTTRKKKGTAFNSVMVEGDLIHSGNKVYIHPVSNTVDVVGDVGKLIIMHEVVPETVEEIRDRKIFRETSKTETIGFEKRIAEMLHGK